MSENDPLFISDREGPPGRADPPAHLSYDDERRDPHGREHTTETLFITVRVPDAGDDYRRVIHRESVGYEREVYDALHGKPVGSRVVVGAWCYERADTTGWGDA